MPQPIEDIVRRNLVDGDRRMGDRLRADQLDEAAAALGSGSDPVAGERALALVVHTRDNRAGCFFLLSLLNPIRFLVRAAIRPDRFDQCWLVTDERLRIRGGGRILEVRWDTVKDARASGAIATFFGWEYLHLFDAHLDDATVMTPGQQGAARLVRAVVRARGTEGLSRARPPWPQASSVDPAGLTAAREALEVDDGRAAVLLGRLQSAWLQGRVDDVEALDLARRIVLFARAVAWGRGAREGAWVTALRPGELRAAVAGSVGPMVQAEPVEAGWTTWLHERSAADAAGRAVAETLLLLAATPRLDLVLPRTDVRLSTREAPGWTAWRIEQKVAGSWISLSEADFKALKRVFDRVLSAEAAALAYRCVVDPRAPAEAVVTASREETLARLQEADPEAGPERFLVARPQRFVTALKRAAPTARAGGGRGWPRGAASVAGRGPRQPAGWAVLRPPRRPAAVVLREPRPVPPHRCAGRRDRDRRCDARQGRRGRVGGARRHGRGGVGRGAGRVRARAAGRPPEAARGRARRGGHLGGRAAGGWLVRRHRRRGGAVVRHPPRSVGGRGPGRIGPVATGPRFRVEPPA